MKRRNESVFQQFLAGVPARLQLRSELHLARRAWHMAMGLVIACLYASGVSPGVGIMILGVLLALSIAVEAVRHKVPAFNDRMIRFWGPVMRSSEINGMSGIPYYLLSALLAIAIFPKPVAILSILYLGVGDPIASIAGISYGDRSIRFANGKSLVGTLAGVAACFLVSWIYLNSISLAPSVLWVVALVGGLVGGLAELLPLETDDNFTIPIVSGFFLWLVFIVLAI